jgi:hypothetical protein
MTSESDAEHVAGGWCREPRAASLVPRAPCRGREEEVQMFLGQCETSVDNYRRMSRLERQGTESTALLADLIVKFLFWRHSRSAGCCEKKILAHSILLLHSSTSS